MKKVLLLISALAVSFIFLPWLTTVAYATQDKELLMICPTVSLKNKNPGGMWVVGAHGAYFVLMPMNAKGEHVHKELPVLVEDKAQIPAGWGLYKDLPTYPYFEGMAMVLDDGVVWGLASGPQFISADQEIPLAAAVFW